MIIDIGGRQAANRVIPEGDNRVFNNIFVNNGWNLGFHSPNNLSDYNLFGQARQPNPFHFMDKDEKLGMNQVLFLTHLDLREWRKRYGFDNYSSEVNIAAEFDPNTLELVWSVRGDFPEGPPVDGITHDFWNRPRPGRMVSPGPFGSIPKETTQIVVDPRLLGN